MKLTSICSAALLAAIMPMVAALAQDAGDQGDPDVLAETDPPLVAAIREGDKESVRTLLQGGADPNIVVGGVSMLMIAVNNNDIESVRALVEAGVDLDARDSRGDSALNYAVYSGHEEIAHLLLDQGANVRLVGHGDAQDIALRFGRENLVQRIAPDHATRAPLFAAAETGDLEKVNQFLSAGADPDTRDSSARTPLHLAAARGHADVAAALLRAGASVDAENKIGFTPLTVAAREGHTELVQSFLDAGADIAHRGSSRGLEMMPLHMAAIRSQQEVVDVLLASGAPLDAEGTEGGTPLAWAIGEGQEEMALYLLNRGGGLGSVMPTEDFANFAESRGMTRIAEAIRQQLD